MTGFGVPLAFALLITGVAVYQYFVSREIVLRQFALYIVGAALVLAGNYYLICHHNNGWIMLAGLLILVTTFLDKVKRNSRMRK